MQTLRAVENFKITDIPISLDPQMIRALGLVKKAAALANMELGILPQPVGNAISATIDLMNKNVKNTPAANDQEHLQIIIEHNPKIPDPTVHQLTQSEDPTIPMYQCAKTLEQEGAGFIAVSCKTAHAFLDRIQHHLTIPFVHMIKDVAGWVTRFHGDIEAIGLLATSGTIETEIYHQAFASIRAELITPDPAMQELVMDAIYGEQVVTAGYTQGKPKEQLLMAAVPLVRKGAGALILGCTELLFRLVQKRENKLANIDQLFLIRSSKFEGEIKIDDRPTSNFLNNLRLFMIL